MASIPPLPPSGREGRGVPSGAHGLAARIASDDAARRVADSDIPTYKDTGWDLSWNEAHVIIYDDRDAADKLAAELGTEAKHSEARHKAKTCWTLFSLVPLP